MSELSHPARQLYRAENIFKIASQRAADMVAERSLWQRLSRGRSAVLSGNLSLLAEAAKICHEAGVDPQSPLLSAIRDLQKRTRRQLRGLQAAHGAFVVAALLLGAIALWELGVLAGGHSPTLTGPQAGDTVDMSIAVNGSFPRGSLPSGTNLYLLVKPQGFNYWLQPLPKVNRTGWRVENVGIGDKEADRGKHFLICAILTHQTLAQGWNAPDLPAGDAHCIDVTRK